jgi:peptidoglycan biosynthesis protein MviN/MurJ (putative lipid II flippase)
VLAIQPVLLSVTLVVLVVACAVLTPRYGAVGTAWALVAGSAVQAVSAAVALRRSRAARRLAAGLADAA